jgi:multisubunit Na+/H+ antiporter MnhC subunit
MIPRAIWLLIVGLLLVVGAYALAFAGNVRLAPWGLALGASCVLAAMLWLGARRAGRLPPVLGQALLSAAVATAVGFTWALMQPAPTADGPLLLGIPRTTALMLLISGAVPMILLPIAYAFAFDREVLDDETLRRVREAAKP